MRLRLGLRLELRLRWRLELRFGLRLGLRLRMGLRLRFGFEGSDLGFGGRVEVGLTFSVGLVGGWSGWVVGDLESKANLNSSCS